MVISINTGDRITDDQFSSELIDTSERCGDQLKVRCSVLNKLMVIINFGAVFHSSET